MSLLNFLRGPSRETIKVGPAQSYTRIGVRAQYAPIVYVSLVYRPMYLSKEFTFPWSDDYHGLVWHMDVHCHLEDGSAFQRTVLFEGPLEIALDFGVMTCIHHRIEDERRRLKEELARLQGA